MVCAIDAEDNRTWNDDRRLHFPRMNEFVPMLPFQVKAVPGAPLQRDRHQISRGSSARILHSPNWMAAAKTRRTPAPIA
jgi:hypothetical protein